MIKLVINSHRKNKVALDHLIQSIGLSANHLLFKCIIVIGGYHELQDYNVTKENNITWIKSNTNSIDYNGLIALSDLYAHETDNYYFYLHDTSRVGPNFFNILLGIQTEGVTSIMMMVLYSMNMGIYSQTIINEFRDYLGKFKNINPNTNIVRLKVLMAKDEDYIFKNDPHCFVYQGYTRHESITGPTDYYKTGTPRIVEYYPNFDLYKIKGNWGLSLTLNL